MAGNNSALIDRLVVVVGGSGFVGRYLVQELVKTGARVRVVVRTPENANFLKPLGGLGQIEIVGGNVTNAASMTAAFTHADAGVNLVGILDERSGQKFAGVQAEGAASVARAAAAANVTAFVQVSAIGADAGSKAEYASTKAAGEAAVTAALPHATIVRPSIVFGPEDQFINRFAAMASGPLPVVPIVAGDTRFQPVFVVDVAKAIVAALADPAAYGGKTFELGGPKVYAFRDIIAWIMREIRSTKSMAEVPAFAAKLMGRAGDIVPLVPMTSGQFEMLQSDNVARAPGLDAFGITPTPLEAVAPAYLERYRTAGRFHRDPETKA
ncbi:complex I NDUFA9 subunit family protein [Glacieibacterium megasporae]|uniref:complex I NDUFA9 subunit family protein n=1 Tax=Glacieibacterium megasporae TaxID=2835787 RepID=UPI00210369AE|nr:complex I NDUFA9 subunit family protein [Polymorphobacter megasporae]